MKVAFRTDASLTIGTGHVMRCLTLARELARRGHDCRFVCRDLPGNLNALVAAEFPLTVLPAPTGPAPARPSDLAPPDHAPWAGVSWGQDAAESRLALGSVEWLIVDHYAFDARWQGDARPEGARVMVIDDLADRRHACDLLLDQNLGRAGADYDGLLPDDAERLIGPRYALLRPEFAANRDAALARRGGPMRRLLIAPGGVDAGNVSGILLQALASLPLPAGFSATVALGPTAPHLAALRGMSLPFPCDIRAAVPDMAALMSEADLCVGAAGGSAWERCALGLPTLLLVLADNQRDAARALALAGAAWSPGDLHIGPADWLAEGLRRLSDPAALTAMSIAAARITDGKGTFRVADALEWPLHLRAATMADAETVWHWRERLPSCHFRAGPNPGLPHHLAWWAKALRSSACHLLMAEGAHLRLDIAGHGAAVSILLAPEARRRGLGLRLLALLERHARRLGLKTLTAEAATGNEASCALFRSAGYHETGTEGSFIRFSRPLHGSTHRDI